MDSEVFHNKNYNLFSKFTVNSNLASFYFNLLDYSFDNDTILLENEFSDFLQENNL